MIFVESSSVKTIGVLVVNFWPPTVSALAPFHSWIPQDVAAASTHQSPLSGNAPGAVDEAVNYVKSTSARTINAALLTPSKL